MRTIRIKLYKFSELSKDAKQKAIEKLCDVNVNFDWWENTYEDAANVGLKITGFDLDRNRHATGEFITSASDCANAIIKDHGENCETYKTAKQFLSEYLPLKETFEKENEGWYFEDENEGEELAQDFLKSILEDYSIMLQHEYEYQTSEEAIIEAIEANEYEFTKDGKLN